MNFREQLKADLKDTFLDCEQFAEEHLINGKKMNVVIDNSELLERAKISGLSATDGTYTSSILVFLPAADFGAKPRIGTLITLDGIEFKVINCTDECGLYSIELKAVMA